MKLYQQLAKQDPDKHPDISSTSALWLRSSTANADPCKRPVLYKVWADANGVNDTCTLTTAAVKEITLQRFKEGQSGCNAVHAAADDSNVEIHESAPTTATQEAGQPQKGPDHLTKQLAAAQKILTQQSSEHAAEQTRLRIRVEVQERQMKEQSDTLESQAARIEHLTKERAASEEQWSKAEKSLKSQLEEQAGKDADHTAWTMDLQAALEAAEEQWSVKMKDLQRQLEQQTGSTAEQTARAKELEAALETAQAAAAAAQEYARRASAASDLSDSHILLRAAGIMQADPTLKKELLTVINK
ncbi:g2539 [Coccomyxa elongata]